MYNFTKVLLAMMVCVFMWPAYADLESNPEKSNQAAGTSEVQPGKTMADTPSHPVSVSAKLDLAQINDRLYARVLLKQTVHTPGRIVAEWTPPINSGCQKSRYALSYQGKQFHTQSYRTVIHSTQSKTIVCSGDWIVKVKDSDDRLLATASFNITPPVSQLDTKSRGFVDEPRISPNFQNLGGFIA